MELVLEDITKKYKDRTAVRNVSARLHNGQLIGLIGKNGAGKTTLLKLLSTILKPTNGRILLDGQDIVKNPNVMRSMVGYLPQEVSAYPNLTISEYLSYIASIKGIKKKDAEKQIQRTSYRILRRLPPGYCCCSRAALSLTAARKNLLRRPKGVYGSICCLPCRRT